MERQTLVMNCRVESGGRSELCRVQKANGTKAATPAFLQCAAVLWVQGVAANQSRVLFTLLSFKMARQGVGEVWWARVPLIPAQRKQRQVHCEFWVSLVNNIVSARYIMKPCLRNRPTN